MTEPGGPRFLTFGTDRTSMSATRFQSIQNETLVLSAVLTDPDGVEDLVGGTLYVDGTTATLGTFATSAQEGAYTMTLTWAQLAAPLEAQAAWSTDLAIPLRAEFFDQAGHVATRTLSVTLSCTSDDPLWLTKVSRNGCADGPRCGTNELGTGCFSQTSTMSGTDMCQQVLGMECVTCRHQSSPTAVSCSDTSLNRACECQ